MAGKEKLLGMANGWQASRILLSGVELGVFAALDGGPLTSAAVAGKIQTDPRATDRLMNALAALELLIKTGDQFRNGPDAAEYLVPGKPEFIGSLGHVNSMWQSWSTLSAAVREGGAVHRREGADYQTWVVPFIAAMEYHSRERAPLVAQALELSAARRVLDVGGGSGIYAREFCRQHPRLEAAIFDFPEVLEMTRQYVAEDGLADRIDLVPGNMLQDELPTGFDVVFISAIIHAFSPQENLVMLQKAARAVAAGGKIVVQDFIMEEDRVHPPFGAFFALNMLVATPAGDTYTLEEVSQWLRECGCSRVRRLDPPGTGTTLVIGEKA